MIILSERFESSDILFIAQEINTKAIVKEKKQGARVKGGKGLQAATTSGSEKRVMERMAGVRKQLRDLIVGFGSDIDNVKNAMKAKTVELELGVAFSAEGKLIVGAKVESTLSLKIVWENGN